MTLSAAAVDQTVNSHTLARASQPLTLLSHGAAHARLRLCLLDTDQARLADRLQLSALWALLEAQQRDYAALPDDGDELHESADRLELIGGPGRAVTELRNEAERQARRHTRLEGEIQDTVQQADVLERRIATLDADHADHAAYELALEKLGA